MIISDVNERGQFKMQNQSSMNSIKLNYNRKKYFKKLIADINRDKFLYLLALPGLVYFFIFKYIPIWGILIAFKDYSAFLGFNASKWVGLKHFQIFFSNPEFYLLLRNTLAISSINLVLFFPLPIIVALMLNEVKFIKFRKSVQSVVYIPHFLSWVIVYALTFLLFSQGAGILNHFIVLLGFNKIDILTNASNFWFVLALQNMWKETGWGTIIFLAAIAGIDVEMYEASKLDGATRIQQIWFITLPSITNVIVLLLILRLGAIMDVGFEQIFLMSNGAVSQVADVFDLYSYRVGIQQGQFSLATAVGLFKSIIGLTMVLCSDKIAKKLGQQGVY